LHIEIDHPKESTFEISMSFDAVRKEHIQSTLNDPLRPAHGEGPERLAEYLKPDRLVPSMARSEARRAK
jgi:hypothetical protein